MTARRLKRLDLGPFQVVEAHFWEEQVAGDRSRFGCRSCGGERHDRGAVSFFRTVAARTWTVTEPACKAAKGTHELGGNPENARRALRASEAHHGEAHHLKDGERCPGCGYGKTVSEGVRFSMDLVALKELLALTGETLPVAPGPRRRRAPRGPVAALAPAPSWPAPCNDLGHEQRPPID